MLQAGFGVTIHTGGIQVESPARPHGVDRLRLDGIPTGAGSVDLFATRRNGSLVLEVLRHGDSGSGSVLAGT